MIHYVKGDLFDTPNDIIAHGVNCRGAFGSGVAKLVATKYPKARFYYLDKHEDDGWHLGDIQTVMQWDGKCVVNCATQDDYGFAEGLYANYDAIRLSLSRLKDFAKQRNYSIAIPKIGAGLAGGDWNIIENIIKEVFSDYDITIYYL